jgi:beta-lactamase class A
MAIEVLSMRIPGVRNGAGVALGLATALGAVAIASPAEAQEGSRIDDLTAVVQPLVDAAAAKGVRVSVGLADISAPNGASTVVGSGETYNPASTIKMALLAAVMRQADRGLLSLQAPVTVSPYMVVGGSGNIQRETMPFTTTVEELARQMVIVSDNTATNVLLYYVGIPTVQTLLDDLGLGTMKFHRQMFPGEQITDPTNVIDAADTVELLRAIYEGNLLTPASRAKVLEWMGEQQVDSKFGAVLNDAPVAHKTGETGSVTHDIGYFLVPGNETVVAVFTEVTTTSSFNEVAAIGNPIIQEIATAVYGELTSR